MDPNFKEWVIVTGGTGFLGQALVKHLLSLNYSVRIITRQISNAAQQELNKYAKTSKLEFYEGDISSYDSIAPAFEQVNYVFHTAGLLNSNEPYSAYERANVKATENICQLCLKYEIEKLIYISTSDVFGLPQSNEIITEDMPYRFWQESYPDSKVLGAKVVKEYQIKGLKSSIIYPGWIYGPGDKAFIPVILQQIKDGIVPIWDNGSFKINLVYIEDLVDGILLTLQNNSADQQDFLLFDDDSGITMADVYQQVASLYKLKYRIINVPYWLMHRIASISQWFCKIGLGKKPLLSTTDVKSFGFPFKFSTAKANRLLKWKKKTSFNEGIQAWHTWYQENN